MLHKETIFKGLALSQGIAVARVCLFNEDRHSNLPMYKVSGKGVVLELQRLERAFELAGTRLDEVRRDVEQRIGPAEAEIFTAQKMILQDETLVAGIRGLIESQEANAEAAVLSVLDDYENRLLSVDNEYIKERSTDFGEVKRRLLDVLANANPSFQCAEQAHCQRGLDRIVIAEELTPSLTVDLDNDRTLGFVTERGGVNGHAAILARALGIPAVSGIANIHSTITCGTEILINGYTGEVIALPTEETVARIRVEHEEDLRVPEAVESVPGFAVLANVNSLRDAELACAMKAEGIGLYRTEFELMTAGKILSEDEQYERYSEVVRRLAGCPVTFRLFDIGGDKPMPFMDMPREENPYLGWRGARLLMDRTELLRSQARAIARAAADGPVRVLYPMIVDAAQFRALKAAFVEATRDMGGGAVEHGVMFEVPAACLQAREILAEADFGSIGTNDLIQYLFAVDRNNERVAYDYRPERPVLWTVISDLVQVAHDAGKPISVCGEVAGDPRFVGRLMKAGIRTVSVSPRLVPGVRLAALAMDSEQVEPASVLAT